MRGDPFLFSRTMEEFKALVLDKCFARRCPCGEFVEPDGHLTYPVFTYHHRGDQIERLAAVVESATGVTRFV